MAGFGTRNNNTVTPRQDLIPATTPVFETPYSIDPSSTYINQSNVPAVAPLPSLSGDLTDQQLQFARQQYEDYKKYVEPFQKRSLADDLRYRREDRQFFEDQYRPLETDLLSSVGYSTQQPVARTQPIDPNISLPAPTPQQTTGVSPQVIRDIEQQAAQRFQLGGAQPIQAARDDFVQQRIADLPGQGIANQPPAATTPSVNQPLAIAKPVEPNATLPDATPTTDQVDLEAQARDQALRDVENQYRIGLESEQRRRFGYGMDKGLSEAALRRFKNDQLATSALAANRGYYDTKDSLFGRRASLLGRGSPNLRPPIDARSPINPSQVGNMFAQAGYNAQQAQNQQRALQNASNVGYGKLAYGATNLFLNRGQNKGQPSGSNNQSGTFYADGGIVDGPGTGTSDSIPAMIYDRNNPISSARVSDGEYVVPANVVRKLGTEYFDKLSQKYHEGGQNGQ